MRVLSIFLVFWSGLAFAGGTKEKSCGIYCEAAASAKKAAAMSKKESATIAGKAKTYLGSCTKGQSKVDCQKAILAVKELYVQEKARVDLEGVHLENSKLAEEVELSAIPPRQPGSLDLLLDSGGPAAAIEFARKDDPARGLPHQATPPPATLGRDAGKPTGPQTIAAPPAVGTSAERPPGQSGSMNSPGESDFAGNDSTGRDSIVRGSTQKGVAGSPVVGGEIYASKGSVSEEQAEDEGSPTGAHAIPRGAFKLAFHERGPSSVPSPEFGPFPDGIGPANGFTLFQRISLRYVHVYRHDMW